MAWTAPRTWVAGEVVTAALVNTHLRDNLLDLADGTWGREVVTVIKSAGETVTNSSTIQSDDHLLFSAAANAKYLVDVVLFVSQNANAVGADFKVGWSLPAGAAWSGGGPNPDLTVGATAAGDGNWTGVLGGSTTTRQMGVDGNTGNVTALFLSVLIEMSSTAGTVNLQWAQNTATAAVGTTVNARSWLRAERIA